MTDVDRADPEPLKRPRGRPSTGARDAIVAAARDLFMERSYKTVSTEQIIAAAGVSRGGLYHHFPGKIDVYRAVFEEMEAALAERLAEAARSASASPFERLRAGCFAYLRECETSEVRRIGLLQSRAVLGWEGWRAVASRYGLALTEQGVRAGIDAGELKPGDPGTITAMLLSALFEGAMLIVSAADGRRARQDVDQVVSSLLDGLRVADPGAPTSRSTRR